MTFFPATRCFVLLAASLAGGCAQGVWIRPGTTAQEAELTRARCDYEASVATPPSQFELRGRPTFGKSLATAIVQGIDEGIRTGLLIRKCMAANGFQLVPMETARAMAVATAPPQVVPVRQAATELFAASEKPPVAPARPQPDVARVAIAEGAAGVAPAPRPSMLAARPQVMASRSAGLVTLPAGTNDASFLLGACSAGDASACLVAGSARAGSRDLY